MRTSFNIVEIQANKLINKMIAAPNPEDTGYWYNQYIKFLELNGWTEDEFDDRMLSNINSSWVDEKELN